MSVVVFRFHFLRCAGDHLQRLFDQCPVRLGAHVAQPEDFFSQRPVTAGYHQALLPQSAIPCIPGEAFRNHGPP